MLRDQFPRLVPLSALGAGILQTAKTIVRVCVDRDPDSGYVLARTLVERAINYGFLNVCDDTDFADWTVYSRQKAFRLFDREKTAGSHRFRIRMDSLPDPSLTSGLAEDIERFTSKKNRRELTSFTKMNLAYRLGSIEGKSSHSKRIMALLLQAQTHVYDLGA